MVPGVVQALKIITEKGSTRIAKFAFDYARKHGAEEDSCDPQGEHYEAVGWVISELLPEDGGGISRGCVCTNILWTTRACSW